MKELEQEKKEIEDKKNEIFNKYNADPKWSGEKGELYEKDESNFGVCDATWVSCFGVTGRRNT